MKKLIILSVCLLFALALATDGLAGTKWDMHLNYPAGNFHSKGAQRFADRVKEATNGELVIVLHPGASLGFKGPELLRAVAEGPTRFTYLERNTRVSPRTLSERLKELAELGLIERVAYPEVPPRVEYTLTERGRMVIEVLSQLEELL